MSQPARHCLTEPDINRLAPGKLNDLRKRFELAEQQSRSGSSGPPQELGLAFGTGGRASGLRLVANGCHYGHPSTAVSRPSSIACAAECRADAGCLGLSAAVPGRAAAAAAALNAAARRSLFSDSAARDVPTELCPSEPSLTSPCGSSSSSNSSDANSSGKSCDEVDLPEVDDCHGRISDCDSSIADPSMLRVPVSAAGRPAGPAAASADGKRHLKSNGTAVASAAAPSCGAAAVTSSCAASDSAAAAAVELPAIGTVALASKLFEKKPPYPSSSQSTTAVGRHAATGTALSPNAGLQHAPLPPPRTNHVSSTTVAGQSPVAAAPLPTGIPDRSKPSKPLGGSHQHDVPARPLAACFRQSETSGTGAEGWRSESHDVVMQGNSRLLEAALLRTADSWPFGTPSRDRTDGKSVASHCEPALPAGNADVESRTAAPEERSRKLQPLPARNQLYPENKQDCSNSMEEKASATLLPPQKQQQQPLPQQQQPLQQQQQQQSQTGTNKLVQQSNALAPPPKPPRTFEHDIYVRLRVKPGEAGNPGMRLTSVRPKSVAEIGHYSSRDDGHHTSDDDVIYDDVVFAGGAVGELAVRSSCSNGSSPSCQPPPPPALLPHWIADGGVSARALSEGDDGTAGVVDYHRPATDSESALAAGSDSRLFETGSSNARKAALPKKVREGLFAKSRILAPLAGLNPMKRYASEDCLSIAAKPDGLSGTGGRVPRAGTRWPTIEEAGSAMMSQVSGKTLSESADWSRERRNNQGRKKGILLNSNGMLRVGSHGDVSKAGIGDSGLPPKSPVMLDMAKIHTKLNGAFAILGEDRRSCLSSLDDETPIEVGQDASIEDGSKMQQKRAGPARDDDVKSLSVDRESAVVAASSDVPDQEVLQKRLKHCISVKQCSAYASASKVREFAGKAYPQLYQYALVVSLRKNSDTHHYEPYVLFKFPPHIDLETTGVPKFCFPDAQGWQRVTEYRSETFTFVLTEGTGIRQYGYCRRFLPPSKGNVPRIPEVVCLVSPLSAFKFYLQVLDEIERRRRISTAEEFLQAAYGKPLPKPGETVAIRAMMDVAIIPWKNRYGIQDDGKDETELVTFARSDDARIDGISYEQLLRTLTSKQIVTCFAAILLERKIVFCAEKLSTLSSCVNALVSLVYPFAWQHTFIPVLPPSMIEVACSPTPFIIGLLSSNLDRLLSLEMDEVLVVNLDSQKFPVTVGDETDILPKQLQKALCLALDLARADGKWRDTFVSETFLRFFFETVGNIRDFFAELEDGERIFEKERLIAASCNGNRTFLMGFLEWFTETQMFDVYIIERLSDPQLKSTSYDEQFVEWTKDYTASLDHPRVQQSFFKSIISRARIRK